MALSSMTGFARGHGVSGSYGWAWEIKSVNGKGLDLRLRLPPGWDAVEPPVRALIAERLARGSVQANLTVERTGIAPVVRVNTAVLDAVLTTVRQLAPRIEASPPSLDGLLALKGVIEVGDAEDFLELTVEERRLVDPRVQLSRAVRELHKGQQLTQQDLAKKLQSSQSRFPTLRRARPACHST